MKLLVSLLMAGICSSTLAAQAPKNIIMIVGDGMGPAYPTAYRMFADDMSTPEVEQTVFDRNLVGMASTHPHLNSGYVTDSAAGATALSSGIKTYNGAIAVDVDKKAVRTVLELAKQQGRKTGVAVTSQINHATPAGFSAHNESRQNYDVIANSYFDDRIEGNFVLDVMLGGGWKYFARDDRDLTKEFQQAGYQYIDDIAKLDQLQKGKSVLGLFADTGLPWALDSTNKQRLPQLTKAAIAQLENENGFFLLAEASQVDWAGHANDIAAAMWEMRDLAITLEWLEQYVKDHPDTLVVLTADHNTGGVSIGANGKYKWEPKILRQMDVSPTEISKQLVDSKNRGELASSLLKFQLTAEESATLDKPTKEKELYNAIKKIIDVRTSTGWTSGGHTGVDVPVFAMGAGREMFIGHSDNTDIAKKIFELLQAK
ncbi:alkaline phosphatase [Paraglaciecola sp. L3A3]|uniref:alkaline phosphatase n=1 Tax=Paraglaciecola sp. L3A3 TaxID=2686358 RepID=UPI00131CEEBF|nr:alkaline phosphatase [Paraglaciecola sp. L3A3]